MASAGERQRRRMGEQSKQLVWGSPVLIESYHQGKKLGSTDREFFGTVGI